MTNSIVHANMGTYFSFSLYLIGMLLIGIYFYRQTSTLSDYILGGRGLNSWVAAMSASASDMSGWLLLGLPGYAYLSGLEATWIALGLLIGTYANWRFIAKRFRNYSEISNDSITFSEFLSNRYKDDSGILKILSAIVILVFFLIYTASGFVAGAKLFHTVFGLPYFKALTIGVFVIISYTFLGGFMAVSWTDFFQGMIMIFAITIVPILAIQNTGGLSYSIAEIKHSNAHLLNAFTNSKGESIGLISILSLMAWGLGYFGQPHILCRFMAIKSGKHVKKARTIAVTWSSISLISAIIIGLIGSVYITQTLDGPASETVFILLVHSITNPLVGGFLLAAILAAIMSTADSQLLVTSSALTEDIYRMYLRKDASEKHYVWIGRLTVIIIAIIAYIIALNPKSNVLTLVGYAWAGFGAAFGPVVILSLFWKRTTRKGAIMGIISGGLMVILWKNIHGGLFDLYELLPAFIIAFLVIIVTSLLDTPPSEEILQEFEKVNHSL